MPLPNYVAQTDILFTWLDAFNNTLSHVDNTSAYLLVSQNATPRISTGNISLNGTATLGTVNASGTITANLFTGNGASLASLNASALTTGTVPLTQLNANVLLTTSSTGINASALSTGTVPFERLTAASATANGVVTTTTQTFAGNKTFDNDVTIAGTLTLVGQGVTLNTNNIIVQDSLIQLAANNTTSDALDIGLYGNYNGDGDAHEHTGLFRDASDGVWKLFVGLQEAPTNTTINITGTGYSIGTLQTYLTSGGVVANSSAFAVTANSSYAATLTINTMSATTVTANLTGTASNATNLNSQPGSFYTNASNLDSGTVPYARLASANTTANGIVNTNTQSFAGDKTFTNNVTVSGTITGNVTGTASNATNLNSQPGTYYTNASNLDSGTVPLARLTSANTTANGVVDTITQSFTGNKTFNNIVTVNAFVVQSSLTANGETGTSGQVLTTNGAGIYWADAGAVANSSGGTGAIQFYNGTTLGSSANLLFTDNSTLKIISNFSVNVIANGSTISLQSSATSNASLSGTQLSIANASGTLTLTPTTLTGTITVQNAASFSNTVSMTGAANALNTLGVTGTLSALSQLSVTANANFNGGTLFVDTVNNRVGIGNTAPNVTLDIYGGLVRASADAATVGFQAARYSDDTTGPVNTFRKYRGTLASPAAVATSDQIGALNFGGYGGTNLRTTLATIISTVETYTSDTNISSRLLFATTNAGTTASTRMIIAGNGNIGMGNTSPIHLLRVEGTGSFSGNLAVNSTNTSAYTLFVDGSFAATTKSFVIPHPTKPTMKLRYGSLEGPENGVYVRGESTTSVITLPEYWSALVNAESLTVSLTPIGTDQRLYVVSANTSEIVVGSSNWLSWTPHFYYVVYGERQDVPKLDVEI